MQITTNTDGTTMIVVDLAELATIDCALGSYLSLAASPRSVGDHACPEDVERANAMEKALFIAYCRITDRVGYGAGPLE